MQNYLEFIIQLSNMTVPVKVQGNMQVQRFISEVCQRYQLPADQLIVYYRDAAGVDRQLNAEQSFSQNRIPSQAVLVFETRINTESPTREFIRRNKVIPLESTVFVCLREEMTGEPHRLSWQPAVIGRRDMRDTEKNKMLAVDLSHVPLAQYISRQHACITRKNGQYYVESIHEQNPTLLDGRRLLPWQRAPLQPGNRIQVGQTTLIFQLLE